MKSLIILANLSLLLFATGCRKVKQLANINVDIPYSQVIEVPAVPGYNYGVPLPAGGVLLPFPAIGLPTNSEQYVIQYNTSIEKVTSVDLKSMAISIQLPADQNFDFLDNISVYISANALPEMLVAYKNEVPKGLKTLEMFTVTSVNLKNYYLQDTVYFRITSHINSVPPGGEQLKLTSVFHMLANPLN